MEKRTKKISLNLTEEQYNLIQWLATKERRSVSELAFLILIDNAAQLFAQRQEKGEWETPTFCPNKEMPR